MLLVALHAVVPQRILGCFRQPGVGAGQVLNVIAKVELVLRKRPSSSCQGFRLASSCNNEWPRGQLTGRIRIAGPERLSLKPAIWSWNVAYDDNAYLVSSSPAAISSWSSIALSIATSHCSQHSTTPAASTLSPLHSLSSFA